MQVIIPCAGESKRFFDQGYGTIKQLLKVNTTSILGHVIDNFRRNDARFYFIFQKKHADQYGAEIRLLLDKANISHELIIVNELTDGAVNTALVAAKHIDQTDTLIIANSDQWVNWDLDTFLAAMQTASADGGMPIFTDTKRENKWSFVAMDEAQRISEVRAKDAFTPHAVVGIYYFKRGTDFIKYGNRLIASNKRVNGEFYVCPVFNELIEDGLKVLAYPVEQMVGLGTPEDFEAAKAILT